MKKKLLTSYLQFAEDHRIEHLCGGVPYAHGDILTVLVSAVKPQKILEVGTGVGYSATCLYAGNETTHIDTIDQHEDHISIAEQKWQELGIRKSITAFPEKIEVVLPELSFGYDLIFFDGYAPSMKYLLQFDRLLKKGGLLITANLFLKDAKGGKYLRHLQKEWRWKTALFDDTAISVKLF